LGGERLLKVTYISLQPPRVASSFIFFLSMNISTIIERYIMILNRLTLYTLLYQWSIYQFFAFIKVYTRCDMLLIRLWRNSSSMIYYIFNNHDFNSLLILSDDSWNNEISKYYRWSWSLRCVQNCSIEFISSELGNQVIKGNLYSFVNWSRIFLIFSTMYIRALFYWNTIFIISSTWKMSKKDDNWSRRMTI